MRIRLSTLIATLAWINSAVLHSFQRAGVAIVDHHTASAQFMQHVAKEEKCGRKVPGDWSWLVPPMSEKQRDR